MTDEGITLTTNSHELEDQFYHSNMRTSLAFIRTIDAEKRTHLAELRTGIGILTIPMSLLTILIATSNYYSISEVFAFIVGLVACALFLFIVGGYLVYSSLARLRGDNRLRAACDDLTCLVSEFNNHDD
ncbi:MAG: hypothetical protein ACFFEE_00060 [Candidatus Thorarchaeota archaeon]